MSGADTSPATKEIDPAALAEAYRLWPDPHDQRQGLMRYGFLKGCEFALEPNVSGDAKPTFAGVENLTAGPRNGLPLEPSETPAQRKARQVLQNAITLRDHFTYCDRTMGDSHGCTCGMDAYAKLLRELDAVPERAK